MKIYNRYEVIKEIGSGGMANVYLALDTILNREVAVKVLKSDMSNDPISLERFKREANTSTKLSHPNAVDVYDVGDEGNSHFIVMEYVKGYTLKQLIKRRGALPYKEAVWIMKQLSGALLEAHKNGIIHRDIKSQNVLIKDDGTVKLADFGIAVLNNSMQITSKGSVLGSVHYLAPELAKGGNPSMQSDIYSLGIVFYELLTGDVPFKADTPIQVALLHVRNDVPSVRSINQNIPQSVENIIIKATSRSLEERYQNMALFIKDLNRCLKPEALNDSKVVLTKKDTTTYSNKVKNPSEVDKRKKIEDRKKKEKRFNTILISVLSFITIVIIVVILFVSGVINPKKSKQVEVPDIKGQSITIAKDILSPLGLSINDRDIEWQMTEDVPEGEIVSFYPEQGTYVEKGTKISIVASEGMYETIPNYVGRNIDDIKDELTNKKITVKLTSIESDEEPGTIISQSGLNPNDKYNPNVSNTIIFEVSQDTSIVIPFGTLGRNIDDVYNELSELGFKVSKELIESDSLSEEEKNYPSNTVCRVSPSMGSLYTQEEDSSIVLYYY